MGAGAALVEAAERLTMETLRAACRQQPSDQRREGPMPAGPSTQLLSDDPVVARRLLELVRWLPSPVWGRDELRTGEMWNSTSVIAWLLAQSGLASDTIHFPAGGRAPGWQAGLAVAHRSPATIGSPQLNAAQTKGT